jgi:hypothetical protein
MSFRYSSVLLALCVASTPPECSLRPPRLSPLKVDGSCLGPPTVIPTFRATGVMRRSLRFSGRATRAWW